MTWVRWEPVSVRIYVYSVNVYTELISRKHRLPTHIYELWLEQMNPSALICRLATMLFPHIGFYPFFLMKCGGLRFPIFAKH